MIYYKIIAFVIFLTFYGCYIIKMLHQKSMGIQTDQLGKGKTGVPKVIEIWLKISSYVIAVVTIISIISYNKIISHAISIIGLILATLGTGIFIKSVMDMKNNWRAGVSDKEKTELITNGIYAWSRNPAFLGFDLTYIGFLMTFLNLPLLIVTVVTVTAFHLQIVNVEEDFLLVRFGQDYVDYQKSVNRYFGKKHNKNGLL